MQYVGQVKTEESRRRVRIIGVAAKRALDLVGAAVLLLLLAPLFVVVAIAIKIDSRGPAFFHQERVGSKRRVRNGKTEWEATTFRVHKFRSMYHGVDDTAHRDYTEAFVSGTAEESGKDNPTFKLVGDARVTRVGQIIRKTSIDELPQLINVLAGEMSLVGPRPVPTYEAENHEPWQMERLHALPGMTGYWQVHGRGQVPFLEMMRMDIYYVRNRSLWLDLKLLALTIPAVFSGRGAE